MSASDEDLADRSVFTMMSKGARLARKAVRAWAHPPEHDKALAELEAWASDVTAMLT